MWFVICGKVSITVNVFVITCPFNITFTPHQTAAVTKSIFKSSIYVALGASLVSFSYCQHNTILQAQFCKLLFVQYYTVEVDLNVYELIL